MHVYMANAESPAALVEAQKRLYRYVSAGLSLRTIDDHQLAASELAWCTAYVAAAESVVSWAREAHEPLADDVAAASVAEALDMIDGASARKRVREGALFESIARRYYPLEDLGLTDEHKLLRATFRQLASDEVMPYASEVHRRDLDVPEDLITALATIGAFAVSVPTAYGGLAAETPDPMVTLIVTEELARASLAIGGSLITRPEILVRALLKAGTAEQKRRVLPAIAKGEKLVAVATTEPDVGSDLANITCRARRVAGGWQVNGTKLWCTFAARAQLLMLLARTSDAGHRGLSVFLVDKPPFPGHEFKYVQPGGGALHGRAIPTIGYRGMHTFELSFDNFALPEDALLGGDEWLNRGFYIQLDSFSIGRLQTAARGVGLMQAALDDASRYTADRVVFGVPIAEHGLPRTVLGRMVVHLAASRQLAYAAASRLIRTGSQVEASLAKLYASRMAEGITRDAMQLYGAMGYAEETSVSRYFVDARVLSIFEGAEDVLALRVVAKDLLKELRW